MTSTKIHVMRHSEVDNPKGILYGHLPGYGLTPLNYETAQRGTDSLRDQGIDITVIISSPLLCTQLTAAPTAPVYDLSVASSPCLIEMDNNFEGLPMNADRSLLLHPSAWENYLRLPKPSWGKPHINIAKCTRAAVPGALKAAKEHEALIVSHQNPITILTRFIRKQPLAHAPWSRQRSLTSIMSFEFEDATLIGISYAEPGTNLFEYAQNMMSGDSAVAFKCQGPGIQD